MKQWLPEWSSDHRTILLKKKTPRVHQASGESFLNLLLIRKVLYGNNRGGQHVLQIARSQSEQI